MDAEDLVRQLEADVAQETELLGITQELDIPYTYLDQRRIYLGLVYKSGWTAQQARAEAVIHWDTTEVRRIGNYNKSLKPQRSPPPVYTANRNVPHIVDRAEGALCQPRVHEANHWSERRGVRRTSQIAFQGS